VNDLEKPYVVQNSTRMYTQANICSEQSACLWFDNFTLREAQEFVENHNRNKALANLVPGLVEALKSTNDAHCEACVKLQGRCLGTCIPAFDNQQTLAEARRVIKTTGGTDQNLVQGENNG